MVISGLNSLCTGAVSFRYAGRVLKGCLITLTRSPRFLQRSERKAEVLDVDFVSTNPTEAVALSTTYQEVSYVTWKPDRNSKHETESIERSSNERCYGVLPQSRNQSLLN